MKKIIEMLEDEDIRNRVVAALQECYKRAMENPGFCYCAAVYDDGEIEFREHYGPENARYMEDQAIAIIGQFYYGGWSIEDNYDCKADLLYDLLEARYDFPDEEKAFDKWRAEELEKILNDDDLDDTMKSDFQLSIDWQTRQIEWFKQHAPKTWFWIETSQIESIAEETEYDGVYEDIVDEYIEFVEATSGDDEAEEDDE